MSAELTYGRKAVLELLRLHPARIRRLSLAEGSRGGAVRDILAAARAAGVPVQYVPRPALDRKVRGGVHQGVVAETQAIATVPLEAVLDTVDMHMGPILVACDRITDPHNLGAIARSCAAAGVAGLLLPQQDSAPLNATTQKAAAGALDRLAVARVDKLPGALSQCRQRGFWVIGTGAGEDVDLYRTDLTQPFVLVLGSEGAGLRPGVRKVCDSVVAVPLASGMESLNVSVAAGVVLFEAVRQRREAGG